MNINTQRIWSTYINNMDMNQCYRCLILTIKVINYIPITYSKRKKWKNATFTIAIAAEIGSLTPRTVHTSELSEPAGMIPIGIDIPSFWLSLLRRPLRTYKPTTSYNLPIINDVCVCEKNSTPTKSTTFNILVRKMMGYKIHHILCQYTAP